MKFKNQLDVALSFGFHGKQQAVAAHGEWECEDRLAYAVKLMGLPLEPVKVVAKAEPKPEAKVEETEAPSQPVVRRGRPSSSVDAK